MGKALRIENRLERETDELLTELQNTSGNNTHLCDLVQKIAHRVKSVEQSTLFVKLLSDRQKKPLTFPLFGKDFVKEL